jgi:hypothetical protein
MLRSALVGAPLSTRCSGWCDPTHAKLDAHLRGVIDLLPVSYGHSTSVAQACAELSHVVLLPDTTTPNLACKRAALLFALHLEVEVQAYFSDEPFARDMYERILPFLMPRFLKHSCQSPEAFVQACVLLADMWEGEVLGNWPRPKQGGAAHDNSTARDLYQGGDGER